MAKSAANQNRSPRLGTPIEAHGLIGNMRTTALASTQGAIDFMCFPRIDSPSLFAALLDAQRGGSFSIAPVLDAPRLKQMYLPETNVLITRFMSPDAVCEIVDFMPVADEGAKSAVPNCVVRLVRSIYGHVSLAMHCAPRFDYARIGHEAEQNGENGVHFKPANGSETIALNATVALAIDRNDAVAHFDLAEGQTACFVLGAAVDSGRLSLPCHDALAQTIAFWRNWSGQSTYRGRYREVVMRSALLLKLLSSREYGAIVAAPTFGLPETPDGRRRWDYRYTWIRDAAFSVYALLRLGYVGEAQAFVRWIAERNKRCHSDGSLRVMYAVDGEDTPGETAIDTLHDSGGAPPLVGNAARDQKQLDVYGALMDAVYLYNKYGEAISHDGWEHVTRTINYVAAHWEEPDHGIWEFRNGLRPLLHSRLMCWVALDRALRLAQKRSLPAPFGQWFEVRDSIHRDIHQNFWNDELESFVQTPGSKTLDASVLMMPLVRFIGPKDQRWLSTLDAIGHELGVDPLIFRYTRGDTLDGLPGEEGGFSACSFWYAEALARAGRVDEGRLVFEKMLAYANHVGLYSEEVAVNGESLGNFPQALTHLALISAAFQLDRSLDGAHAPWS
ncbi:glycoside hydrolase family 15 protein [Paraburkholderia sediminicola]|uniref:glycoside hydrolase family 15 protein n=1 Tax=Paraburkholderia sediminicola TaxID=458836 RepID=UPI0038BC18A9